MLASEIQKLRKDLRLNQVEFAQLNGVHPITVSKWERNQTTPTPYQQAMFKEFHHASQNQEIRDTIKNILIGAGVALALALLLRHLITRK